MKGRYVFAVVAGTLVTLSLLFIMHLLIEFGESALSNPRDRHTLEFVRINYIIEVHHRLVAARHDRAEHAAIRGYLQQGSVGARALRLHEEEEKGNKGDGDPYLAGHVHS